MIYLVSDHGGWEAKLALLVWLKKTGVAVVDMGPQKKNSGDDYPRWAEVLARQVAKHADHRGVALCRSGVGMAMAANKVAGIRATQAWNVSVAKKSRHDENANILSLGADFLTIDEMKKIITAWLREPFQKNARYLRRLRELKRLDHGR